MSKLIPESMIRYEFPLFHNHPRLKRYWFSSYPTETDNAIRIFIQFTSTAPQSYVFHTSVHEEELRALEDGGKEQFLLVVVGTLIKKAYEALKAENPFETLIYETTSTSKYTRPV